LALLDVVVEADDVPTMDVAEDLDLAHLDDDSSVLVATHRHTRFEETLGRGCIWGEHSGSPTLVRLSCR